MLFDPASDSPQESESFKGDEELRPVSSDSDAPAPAEEDRADLSDSTARAQALNIHRSWVVEAPAGSGKTGLLIQRLLKLLAYAEITSPSEILAITFTRKAAQEMRTRVLEQLAGAAQNRPLPPGAGAFEHSARDLAQHVLRRDKQFSWHLLDSPQGLNIRTIDSFCGELARSMPMLAGGTAHRRPVEAAYPLFEEAAGRVMRALGGADLALDRSLRTLLLHRDGRVGDCVALIAGMLAMREQWGELIPLTADESDEDRLDREVRQHLEQTLEMIVSQGLARTRRSLPQGWLDDLASFAARMSLEPGHGGSPSPLTGLEGLVAPPGETGDDHDHWVVLSNLVLTKEGSTRTSLGSKLLGFELPKQGKPELQNLIERLKSADALGSGAVAALHDLRALPPARMPDEQWVVLKAAFHVLRRALLELEVLFAEQKVCDFTALALTARHLLDPGADEATDTPLPGLRLQHLLVDEMQDTSIGQYRLFERLTRFWDGSSQTVFLVGDPKQSIYAFRQARVERFLRTQRTGRLGDLPLGSLQLTANFRSQAELVRQLNETFAPVLSLVGDHVQRGTDAFQNVEVPFTAAVPARSAGTAPALHWHPRIEGLETKGNSSASDSPGESHAAADAHAIRSAIEDYLRRTVRSGPDRRATPPRVAVLGRNRAHLAPVIAELQRDRGAGPLPFRAVEIEVLNERPEVLDLLALTRALLHPGDRVAWLAVLRSPVCGLSLADLLMLTGEGEGAQLTATVAYLVRERQTLLSVEGQQLLQRTWPILAHAQATLGRSALATHVERTWRSLGADAPLSPNALANARRFLLLLHQLEDGPEPLHLQTLERRLRKLYAEASEPDAAVELMTIHKSKGLEWDLVLVPALDRTTGQGEGELLRWFELDGAAADRAPVILAPLAGKGEKASRLWAWLGRLQKQRELAEAKRLFYVACTRAREELHLYGTAKLTTSGGLAQPSGNSLLRAAWPAACTIFQQRFTDLQAGSASDPSSPPLPMPAPLAFPLPDAAATAEPLSLAASSTEAADVPLSFPDILRLPADFDAIGRFRPEHGPQLPYAPASTLRHAAPFARPEGSFAARAFGNVTHRFLDLLATKLAAGQSLDALAAELPQWSPRLFRAFRAEGIAPALCGREAARVLRALEATMLDPVGQWLLSPHAQAWTERTLQVAPDATRDAPATLRADRVFLGGSEPLAVGASSHLWIVDFKTADLGGRRDDAFFAAERKKYSAQMQSYARACQALGESERPITLALFYPLLTHLLYWPFVPQTASELQAAARARMLV